MAWWRDGGVKRHINLSRPPQRTKDGNRGAEFGEGGSKKVTRQNWRGYFFSKGRKKIRWKLVSRLVGNG